MRFKLLTVSLLSTTLLLTACGQHDNGELKNNDSEKSENKENSNNKNRSDQNQNNRNSQQQNQITARDAEQIVHDHYINDLSATEAQVGDFKTNMQRSNANEFYVEYFARDAAGTPFSWCAIVNRSTGEIIDKFNDMSEEEQKNLEELKKNSPIYNPNTNKPKEQENSNNESSNNEPSVKEESNQQPKQNVKTQESIEEPNTLEQQNTEETASTEEVKNQS
ncbi:hypothetical protein [Staphylococcus haemolyticus]|uniref:hypothetical protein n=1 Tax=Staphylococcus haemolyticus TaxID=1283 RepID=UPI00119D8A5E|nr:hypothetical protein [Staphylococcus haemolyticus]MCE0454063.1 hypothetical protein [Staphylococcus haemolyticus]MCH4502080.1 hypothetical protein [Staphylococcus haemolyticus]